MEETIENALTHRITNIADRSIINQIDKLNTDDDYYEYIDNLKQYNKLVAHIEMTLTNQVADLSKEHFTLLASAAIGQADLKDLLTAIATAKDKEKTDLAKIGETFNIVDKLITPKFSPTMLKNKITDIDDLISSFDRQVKAL